MLQIVCYLINLLLMQQNERVNFLNEGFLSFFFLKVTFQITLWVPLSLWSEVNKEGWQTRECA